MLDVIFDLIKRAMERDEKSRKFSVTLADSYLRRISRFQDQLVLLGIFLNFSAAGFVLVLCGGFARPCASGIISGLGMFSVNLLLAKLYSNEHLTTKLLFARYPELELIMVGDKSWSNFRVLAGAYKCVQAGWILFAALLTGSSVAGWLGR
jgi:hypothetical protein